MKNDENHLCVITTSGNLKLCVLPLHGECFAPYNREVSGAEGDLEKIVRQHKEIHTFYVRKLLILSV